MCIYSCKHALCAYVHVYVCEYSLSEISFRFLSVFSEEWEEIACHVKLELESTTLTEVIGQDHLSRKRKKSRKSWLLLIHTVTLCDLVSIINDEGNFHLVREPTVVFDWTQSQSNTTLHSKEMKIFSTSNSLTFVLPGNQATTYNTYLNARKLKILQTTKASLTSFKRNVLSWLARRCQNFVKSGRLSRSPTSARWSFKTNSISHAEAERPSVGASSFWDWRANHLLSTG